jgi:predicted metalloprotease with PDZ domain
MNLDEINQPTRRAGPLIWLIVAGVGLGVAFWGGGQVSREYATRPETRVAIDTMVTNPVEFAKSRIMGGIGVSLKTNSLTGLPVITLMLIDSPAEKAGLRVDDTIVMVDGMSTTNKPLEELRRKVHGFAKGKVVITVLRGQSNLVECIVHRNSWNKLRSLTSNPYE